MRDLGRHEISWCIHAFAQSMRKMRTALAQAEKLYYPRQKQWWFLELASIFAAMGAGDEFLEGVAKKVVTVSLDELDAILYRLGIVSATRPLCGDCMRLPWRRKRQSAGASIGD